MGNRGRTGGEYFLCLPRACDCRCPTCVHPQSGPGSSQWCEVLLDVLLALLSRPAAPLPSAPLRSACEAVWRAACEGLTAVGMQVRCE